MTEEQDWGALEESGDETAYLLRSESIWSQEEPKHLTISGPVSFSPLRSSTV